MSFGKGEKKEREGFFFLPVGDLFIKGKNLKANLLWNVYWFALKFWICFILKNHGHVTSTQLVTYLVSIYAMTCILLPQVSEWGAREQIWKEVVATALGSGFGCESPDFELGPLSHLPHSTSVLCGTSCALIPAASSIYTSQQNAQPQTNLVVSVKEFWLKFYWF